MTATTDHHLQPLATTGTVLMCQTCGKTCPMDVENDWGRVMDDFVRAHCRLHGTAHITMAGELPTP